MDLEKRYEKKIVTFIFCLIFFVKLLQFKAEFNKKGNLKGETFSGLDLGWLWPWWDLNAEERRYNCDLNTKSGSEVSECRWKQKVKRLDLNLQMEGGKPKSDPKGWAYSLSQKLCHLWKDLYNCDSHSFYSRLLLPQCLLNHFIFTQSFENKAQKLSG